MFNFDIQYMFLLAGVADKPDTIWITSMAGMAAACVTGLITWFLNRKKSNTDEYVALLTQSSELRDELRKDRESIREELSMARSETDLIKRETSELKRKIDMCNRSLEACKEIAEQLRLSDQSR